MSCRLRVEAASLAMLFVVAGCGASGQLGDPDAHAFDQLGFSVAIDGDRILVGVAKSDTVDSNGGKALVYHRNGGVWSLVQSLVASTPSLNANFGWSVGIAGERAIVGTPNDHSIGPIFTGAAYIQELNGVWSEVAKVLVDTIDSSFYGSTVAIDGDWAVVGAPFAPAPLFTGPGVAWVYRRNPGTGAWQLHEQLGASDAIDYIEFGRAVAIDGDVIVVGAEKGVKNNAIIGGAVYVFRRQGMSWNEEAKLTASDAAYHDRFGAAVDVSGDVILVGAKDNDAQGAESGAAYIFEREAESATWSQTQQLLGPGGDAGDQFGYAVSIDGARAIVGAWLADGEAATTGTAHLYHRSGNSWAAGDTLQLPGGAYGDGFGASVAISGDCAVVGAPNRDVNGLQNAGTAWVWCNLPGLAAPDFELDIICCVEVPDPLGPVVITARFINAGERTAIGRRWIEVVGPEGAVADAAGATALAIPAGDSAVERHPLRLPRSAPAVDYEIRLHWQDGNGIRTRTTRVMRPAVR